MRKYPDGHPELPIDPDAERSQARRDARPHHHQPILQAYVVVGGLLGAAARYGIADHWPTRAGHFPTGTLAVNLIGAFILGALLEGLARLGGDVGWRQPARLSLGTGFCGALTTYSTLATESDLLVRSHDTGLAAIYMAVSVVAGLAATALGVAVASGAHHQHRLRSAA